MGSSWLKDSNSLTARVFKDSGGGGVQSLSHIRLLATPRTAEQQASLSFTISQSLLKLMAIKSVMPSNQLILCHPLLLLLSVFSTIRFFLVSQLFTLGGQGIGASASASVLPMSIQGWFPLGLADLISLLSKHHSLKASFLWHSATF